MITLTQVVLVIVITTLTVLLTFIGIQVVYILKDLRGSLRRINKIIDNAEAITDAVVRPIEGISSVVEGLQSSLKIAELLGYVKDRAKKTAHEIPERIREAKENFQDARRAVDSELDAMADEAESQDRPRLPGRDRFPHFFHRSGTPLG